MMKGEVRSTDLSIQLTRSGEKSRCNLAAGARLDWLTPPDRTSMNSQRSHSNGGDPPSSTSVLQMCLGCTL
jgi:hypothetical protein